MDHFTSLVPCPLIGNRFDLPRGARGGNPVRTSLLEDLCSISIVTPTMSSATPNPQAALHIAQVPTSAHHTTHFDATSVISSPNVSSDIGASLQADVDSFVSVSQEVSELMKSVSSKLKAVKADELVDLWNIIYNVGVARQGLVTF